MIVSPEPLPWDSNFFGFKVGKIIAKRIDGKDLKLELDKLKLLGFRLIYLIVDSGSVNDYIVPSSYTAIDTKITYRYNSEDINPIASNEVQEYESASATPELTSLALESGKYSRFKIDRNFDEGTYESLYSTWLTNSLNKKNADHTFVYLQSNKIVGFITLKISGQQGTIGLIAVNPNHQGKGIGKALINSTINFLRNKKINTCYVSTQLANTAACKLYERCGFLVSSSETFYHIWL